MNTDTKLRLFIGVKIAANIEIIDCQQDFRQKLKNSRMSWVVPENMHITLEFLGDTPENIIPELIENLHKTARKLKAFKSNVSGCGVFGHPSSPKVLWIGMTKEKAWKELYFAIIKAIGKTPSENPFNPHLTLARFKDFSDSRETLNNCLKHYAQHVFLEADINQFQLFQSILTPKGPVYKTIETFRMNETLTTSDTLF